MILLTPEHVLAALDAFGSLVMLWSAARITTRASWGTSVEKWALIRRCIYYNSTFALGGLAMRRGFDIPWDWWDLYFGASLIFAVTGFPVLRALGMINQDEATDGFNSMIDQQDGDAVQQYQRSRRKT